MYFMHWRGLCFEISAGIAEAGGQTMNEVWKRIFKEKIECYQSILILFDQGIFDEEEKNVFEHNLLHSIIETMKSEIYP